MGALWGLGGLTFGLTMRYLGHVAGHGDCPGLLRSVWHARAADGAKVNSPPNCCNTHGGNICFLGVIVCLVGIAIGGIAGVRKEKDMGRRQTSAIAEFNLWKGLGIATFSGIMSSCFSFGFQFGDPISKISADAWHRPVLGRPAGDRRDFAGRSDHEFHLVRTVAPQKPNRAPIF